ncbi:hypothetical protein OJP00_00670 [Campylobacter lari]|uniref:hypothetical protein n=1 Tax=Campylobacter lari TaxID=201 RepID=UPI0021F758C2|nr:hypothetical protein [Campylobacter lari]MCW0185079.1 hypothetical protein [Campylobacter lari]
MGNNKKILLIGASNSMIPRGFKDGLSQEGIELNNLSIGGSIASSKIYTILKYKEYIKEVDLVILEYNLAEVDRIVFDDIGFKESIRNTCWLYEELYKTNKKVLNLILVNTRKLDVEKYIRNIHKLLCNKYGFNSIDMHGYYENREILNFFSSHPDPIHQIAIIMYNLGKNIADNISYFKYPRKNIKKNNPSFIYLTPIELIQLKNKPQRILRRDILFQQQVIYRIDKNIEMKFPKNYKNWVLIGMHAYNDDLNAKSWKKKSQSYGNVLILNIKNHIVKSVACFNIFLDIRDYFKIDCNTYIRFCKKRPATENSFSTTFSKDKTSTLDYVDISAFLLADQNGKFDFSEEIELIQNEDIVVDSEYDFTHLVPPVEDYKTAIEEYNIRMDPIKLQPLQNQISILNSTISLLEQNKIQLSQEKDKIQQDNIILKQTLNSLPIKKQQLEISNLEQDLINKKLQTKQLSKKLGIKMNDFMPKITMISPSSAKARIQNQLSYKLGQAVIINSKSILGYIRMPFVLSYIKDKHKQEQKIYQEKIKKDSSLILPPLESYPDYQEALKLKNHLSYKLGEALIQANKTWYGGGISSCCLKLGS